MNEKTMWIWLALGLAPFRIRYKHLPHGASNLEIRALRWSVKVTRHRNGLSDWRVCIPLVEHVRDLL